MTAFLLLLAGLTCLLLGGAGLVRGATGLAHSYGVSPLLVGLTIVAFGTSAPELMVNVVGALKEQTDIAFGNIAGSNLANLGLVLGGTALMSGLNLNDQIIKRDIPLLLLASLATVIMILDPMLREQVSSLDLSDGLILLLLFCIFMYMTFKDLSESSGAEESITGSSFWDTRSVNWSLVAVGAVGLAIGGELVITHGVALAAILGVSSTIIGIGLVAIGTSLPELVTSIIAALKKEADLCVGNIVGSNIFNLLLVLPITAVIYPIKTDASGALDIGVSLALTAFLVIIFLLNKGVMGKPLGALFLLGYFFYMSYRIFI
ncbi:calcium/sodium antiporter [Gammaproteobacteria bacterium]|nr:calcium/sodium antiporter [Gammaproteobacteria bacterium]